MYITDTKQFEFLRMLREITNQYKENSFRSKFDITAVFYVPVDLVNIGLENNKLNKCEDLQELINKKFIHVEEDNFTHEMVATITSYGYDFFNHIE